MAPTYTLIHGQGSLLGPAGTGMTAAAVRGLICCWVPIDAGMNPAVRRSTFLRRCVCMGPSEVEDPLDEL